MDLLTIGGIASALVLVLTACFIMFKLLSRETTFEEAYSDSAIKLLTNQPITEKGTKKDKHKHKPKRKQSPKDGRQTNNKQTEEEVNVSQSEMPSAEVGKSEMVDSEEKKTEEEGNSKQKRKSDKHKQKMKSKSPKAETNSEGAEEKEIPNGQLGNEEEKRQNDFEEVTEERAVETQPTAKKSKKSASLKDISMPQAMERLKEIGELEPEYINYLQEMSNDVKAKENKFRTEIKELKTEKNEFEKNLKNATAEMETLRFETDKIMKEKKEQNDRHLIFEQTVRQKLVETVQLKEENKKLVEMLEQTNAKFAQTDHQFTQKLGMINHELIKAREECAKHKNYTDAVTAEAMKTKQETEEALRKAHINFEGTLKALQAELNKEREQRKAQDKECQMAKNMVDQMMSDVSNSQNQLKDAMVSKSAYDDRIQTLQNELNREKDHHMKVMVNAQKQVGELSQELEKALVAYGNLAKQQSNDSAKCVELNARNQKMGEEISQLKNEAKCASEVDGLKNSVAELTKSLEEQKKKNQDMQNEKEKLMDDLTQKAQTAQHSLMNGGPKSEIANTADQIANSEQLDRLTKENQSYKRTLDSLNDQLEKVSRIAEELEREKDTKIAELEERLAQFEQ